MAELNKSQNAGHLIRLPRKCGRLILGSLTLSVVETIGDVIVVVGPEVVATGGGVSVDSGVPILPAAGGGGVPTAFFSLAKTRGRVNTTTFSSKSSLDGVRAVVERVGI